MASVTAKDAMKLSDFDYALPPELIAQHPLKKRDQARLMILDRATQTITHDQFSNLHRHVAPQSLFVVNDSKVVPARLMGHKENGGREVEIFLLKALEDRRRFQVLIRPLKKVKNGECIVFEKSALKATIIDYQQRIVEFNASNVMTHVRKIGHMPLPPYIRRDDELADKKDYQTVYAKHWGSVAAPTAGLHFTHALMRKLKHEGHEFEKVTLHVNYGTFRPVQQEDITQHQMHEEEYHISRVAAKRIVAARARGRKIIGVGTTSCRVLETYASNGQLCGDTKLFAYPGFSFKMVDVLLTNFHLPKSTLLMLVCAFASTDFVMRAYQEAIKERYRFYSYGDCMLIK